MKRHFLLAPILIALGILWYLNPPSDLASFLCWISPVFIGVILGVLSS